jgi:hypothetical protein
MTVISIKQDNAVYILDEDNNFVCAHVDKFIDRDEDSSWTCDDCEMYAPAYIDGIDDEGHPEYRAPEPWEWQ